MGGPGRQRVFKGGAKANELAGYLCALGDRNALKTATWPERFPGSASASTWALFLNGSKLIPKKLLGEVLEELISDRRVLARATVEALQLWKEAEAEARRERSASDGGDGGELVGLHRRLSDALEGQARAQAKASKSANLVSLLIPMAALMQEKVQALTAEWQRAHDLRRAEAQVQLERARRRLERTETELDKAKRRRYTAEQAQQALARDALEARREIEELQQRVGLLAGSAEPVALVSVVQEPSMEDIDDELDRIALDGAHDDVEIAELTEQAGLESVEVVSPRVVLGTVVASQASAPDASPSAGEDADVVVVGAEAAGAVGEELSRTTQEILSDRGILDLVEITRGDGGPYQATDFMADLKRLVEEARVPAVLLSSLPHSGPLFESAHDDRALPSLDVLHVLLSACRLEEGLWPMWMSRWQTAERNTRVAASDFPLLVGDLVNFRLALRRLILDKPPAHEPTTPVPTLPYAKDILPERERFPELAYTREVVLACEQNPEAVRPWERRWQKLDQQARSSWGNLKTPDIPQAPAAAPLSRTTPDNRPKASAMAADHIRLLSPQHRAAGASPDIFLTRLRHLIEQHALPYDTVAELAPSPTDLDRLLSGQMPSLGYARSLFTACEADVVYWEREWHTADKRRRRDLHNLTPSPSPHQPTPPPKNHRVKEPAWATPGLRFFAYLSAVLTLASFALATAAFTAGLQADPGPAIWKLVLASLLLPIGAALFSFILLVALMAADPATPDRALKQGNFIGTVHLSCLTIGTLSGLIGPWIADINQPGHWTADLLGLL